MLFSLPVESLLDLVNRFDRLGFVNEKIYELILNFEASFLLEGRIILMKVKLKKLLLYGKSCYYF